MAAVALADVLGQESHADAVLPGVRQLDVERSALPHEEFMRHLNEDAGAITRARIGPAGAAVPKVDEHLQPLPDYRVRFRALDVGDQADATGVVLVRRIVKTLTRRRPERRCLRAILHNDLGNGESRFAARIPGASIRSTGHFFTAKPL